jgi:hypothetical protein
MGKAITNLKKSIKECYEEEYEYEQEIEEETFVDLEEEYDEKLNNLSFKIKCALINYSQDSGYPLCEYLDIENVKNYIKWLLESHTY